MKTKLLIIAFAVAVIASFSFITIKNAPAAKDQTVTKTQSEPMSGFALEDENQF